MPGQSMNTRNRMAVYCPSDGDLLYILSTNLPLLQTALGRNETDQENQTLGVHHKDK